LSEKIDVLSNVIKYLGLKEIRIETTHKRFKSICPNINLPTKGGDFDEIEFIFRKEDDFVEYYEWDEDHYGKINIGIRDKLGLALIIDFFLEYYKSDVKEKAKKEVYNEIINSRINEKVTRIYS